MKINTETYEQLKKYSDDIVYDDKEEYTVVDWINCYGGTQDEQTLAVQFGSTYAVYKMLKRHQKQTIRDTLKLLFPEDYMNGKENTD